MKVLLGIQARSQSKRLPRKIYETIGPKSLLKWVYDAAKSAQKKLSDKNISSQVKVLAPNTDQELLDYCGKELLSYSSPICAEDDLIKRYLLTAREMEATHVIRITADCWQLNPEIICEVVHILKEGSDYCSNTIHRSFIEGWDTQGCSIKALEWFDENQKELREHPFYFFDRNEMVRQGFERMGFKFAELLDPKCQWVIRTSIDDESDLEFARGLYEREEATRRLLERKIKDSPRTELVRNEQQTI